MTNRNAPVNPWQVLSALDASDVLPWADSQRGALPSAPVALETRQERLEALLEANGNALAALDALEIA